MATAGDPSELWRLVEAQYGVVTRSQLLKAGLSPEAIRHRLRRGRLYSLHRGVYAVGRPEVPRKGRWLAAVLACGTGAALSFGSAAALWGIERELERIEVSLPRARRKRHPGILAHRPLRLEDSEIRVVDGIPVTDPVRTLIDLASLLPRSRLEAAINAADRLDLVKEVQLHSRLGQQASPEPAGVAKLRRVLDRDSFTITDSELERRFLVIAKQAGLPRPETGVWLNGFKVDFHWPCLGLIVETDGLTYHRTASQQARDRRRDQAHTAAGLTTLRFTNAQVRNESVEVVTTLRAVAGRLEAERTLRVASRRQDASR
jgi:very-short-patch-repair endonuclease